MLRKIKLYGELAKFLGQKTFEAEVNNVAQAMRFLVVNFPQLEKHMADKYYKVAVGSWELTKEELSYPNGQEDIKIIPVIKGSGGLGKTIAGIALIGFAVATGGAFLTFGAGGFGAVESASIGMSVIAGNLGLGLTILGVAQMLTPVETISENEQDPRVSFNFSGIQNTSRAGVAVPLIYGTTLTGSITVSAHLENEQVEV